MQVGPPVECGWAGSPSTIFARGENGPPSARRRVIDGRNCAMNRSKGDHSRWPRRARIGPVRHFDCSNSSDVHDGGSVLEQCRLGFFMPRGFLLPLVFADPYLFYFVYGQPGEWVGCPIWAKGMYEPFAMSVRRLLVRCVWCIFGRKLLFHDPRF